MDSLVINSVEDQEKIDRIRLEMIKNVKPFFINKAKTGKHGSSRISILKNYEAFNVANR